jgi:anti-sigma-K factor RskA
VDFSTGIAMQDSELKKLLLETCPVLPGQENRAWTALQARLNGAKPESRWAWLYLPSWRGFGVAVAILAILAVVGNYIGLGLGPISLATADSKSPGVYATSFYSHTAKAQVVWLDGMEPASDKPTYLDPTTVVPEKSSSQPTGDPNSL